MTCFFHDVNQVNPLLIGREGMDPVAGYQMIPIGENRTVGFQSFADEPEDIIIFPTQTGSRSGILRVVSKAGPAPTETKLGLVVKPGSAVEMVLEGRTIGRAAFEARQNTDEAKLLKTLMVSVKPKRPLSYQLCVLSDPIVRLTPAVVSPNLIANMLGAEPIWLKAANVELARVGPVIDVQTSFAIGDPTKPGNPIVLDEVKLAEIIRATNDTAGVQQADIHMYAAWDLRVSVTDDTVGLGDKVHKMGWIESHLSGSFGTVVAAHEIGHILKLEHPVPLGADVTLLMDGFGNSRLRMFEIETANPR